MWIGGCGVAPRAAVLGWALGALAVAGCGGGSAVPDGGAGHGVCGDHVLNVGEECEAPFAPCCDHTTCRYRADSPECAGVAPCERGVDCWIEVTRTFDPVTGDHDVAYVGYTPAGGLQSVVFAMNRAPGDGRIPIYNCQCESCNPTPGSVDTFLSTDSGCEGALHVGGSPDPIGYVVALCAPDFVPFYQCAAPGDRFVSRDPACEGQTRVSVLAYTYCSDCTGSHGPRQLLAGDALMVGSLSSVDDTTGAVQGWALNTADLDDVVTITWRVNDAVQGTVVADQAAASLARVCPGCANGFAVTVPPAFRGTGYSVTIEGTSAKLPGPRTLATRQVNPVEAECDIDGGMGVQLTPVFQATRAACQAACDSYAAANPNRTCLWGGGGGFEQVWLKPPAELGHCYVTGGAGAELWPNTTLAGYETRAGCLALCESFSQNVCRTCQWADEWLKPPGTTATCEIVNGGAPLEPAFTSDCNTCNLRCSTWSSQPSRVCRWGGAQIFP